MGKLGEIKTNGDRLTAYRRDRYNGSRLRFWSTPCPSPYILDKTINTVLLDCPSNFII